MEIYQLAAMIVECLLVGQRYNRHRVCKPARIVPSRNDLTRAQRGLLQGHFDICLRTIEADLLQVFARVFVLYCFYEFVIETLSLLWPILTASEPNGDWPEHLVPPFVFSGGSAAGISTSANRPNISPHI